MKSHLYKLLGARKDEEDAMEVLIVYGFFMGIFLASFQPASLNLFIEHYAERVDEAYLVQGVYGLFGAFVYSVAHRYFRFSLIVKLQPLFILVITILGYVLYANYHYEEVAYLLFVFFGPFQVISGLIFWGLFGRVFKTYQSKRVIGGIDTGTLTAMILTFFTIPFILHENNEIFNDSADLFFISAGAICCLFFVTLNISKKFPINNVQRLSKKEKRKVSFKSIFSKRITIYLSLFLICSTIIAKFVDFSYINLIDKQYPDENPRLNFLSFAEGSIMILSFLMQTFFNDRIIFNYGLRISLTILPAILLLFTLTAIPIGFISNVNPGAILPFFILVAVCKIISSALRDSLENPTYKLFFLIYEPKIRFEFQNKIEGTVNQFGTLIAGFVMTMLGLLWFKNHFFEFTVNHALVILLFVIVIIFYVIKRMYDSYRIELQSSLTKSELFVYEQKSLPILSLLEQELKTKNSFSKLYSTRVMEMADPIHYQSKLLLNIFHTNKLIQLDAMDRIKNIGIANAVTLIEQVKKTTDDAQVVEKSEEVISFLRKKIIEKKLKSLHFYLMGKSRDPRDRIFLAQVLYKYRDEAHETLVELMQDDNYYVRKIAVITAVSINSTKLWTVLIDMLGVPEQRMMAICALVAMGEPVVDVLNFEYDKAQTSKAAKRAIIDIYVRLGTIFCKRFLWQKLIQDIDLHMDIAIGLSNLGLKADILQKVNVKNKILIHAELIYWNKIAISELEEGLDDELIETLKLEIRHHSKSVFTLLTLIYDYEAIELMKENIFSNNYDKIAFSIELMNVLIEENLKKILTLVLDEISVQEMQTHLEFVFFRRKYSRKELLLEIISRSGSKIGVYPKCVALESLFSISNNYFTNELIATLFDSNEVFNEMSYFYFYKKDSKKTREIADRMKDRKVINMLRKFDNLGNNLDEGKLVLRFHCLRKLKTFAFIDLLSPFELMEVAEVMKVVRLREGAEMLEKNDWAGTHVLHLVYGELYETKKDGSKQKYISGNTIGIDTLLKFDLGNYVIAKTDCFIITLPYSIYYEKIFVNEDIYLKVKDEVKRKFGNLFKNKILEHKS